MTIKELLDVLNKYPNHFEIITEQNSKIIHIINIPNERIVISDKKPIGYCNKCGEYVYKEEELDYTGICPTCDENLYNFEINDL